MDLNDNDRRMLVNAYGLLGDGQGNEWDLNPEYTRAVAELVRDALGLDEREDALEAIREAGLSNVPDPRFKAGDRVVISTTRSTVARLDGKCGTVTGMTLRTSWSGCHWRVRVDGGSFVTLKDRELSPEPERGDQEHVILVAVSVTVPDGPGIPVNEQTNRAYAERWLHQHLNQASFRGAETATHVDSWWIAEDDRRDGSDCDSAVFVPGGPHHTMGQRFAHQLLSEVDAKFRANACTAEQMLRLVKAADLFTEDVEGET